jgi:hypothetical protein
MSDDGMDMGAGDDIGYDDAMNEMNPEEMV